MKFPRNAKIFRGPVDAAPLVSVLFLLILFLLLNTSLVFTPGVKIRLPAAGDFSGTANPTVAVAVDPAGQLYFESQVIAELDLRARLAREIAASAVPLTLVIQADESVNYRRIVHLTKMARELGLREVLLATQPKVFSDPTQP